jgi:hypothetical protein
MGALNPKYGGAPERSEPATGAVAMTRTDVTYPTSARGFHCNVAGSISLTMLDNSTATFTCSAGVTYPYAHKGTLASGSASFEGYALL